MAERFTVGFQLELMPGAADGAAMADLVAAVATLLAPDGAVDWGGHAKAGRVEVMAEVTAEDARDALGQGMAALRRALAETGPAFEGHRVRSVGAQPIDNPPEWAYPS